MDRGQQDIPTLALSHYLWERGELAYKLDPLQSSIHNTVVAAYPRAKQICVLSSRQIGKSFWALVFALIYLIKNPGSIVRILAPTKIKAYELIEDNLLPIMGDCPPNFIRKQKTQLRWNIESNNSSLRIGPLESAHVDTNRSGNAKLVIYEECGFVSGDEFNYARQSVIGPQLLRSNGHEIFVTSPSRDPEHPLHNIVVPECDLLGTLFRYTVYDSPSLTKEQIEEAARRSGGFDSEDFQREYMAKIIRSASLMVIPRLDERITFGKWDIPNTFRHRIICTGDWGGVKDMTVFLLHFYEPMTDLSYVIKELVFPPNTVTDIIAKPLKDWIKKYGLEEIWADVPGQLSIDLTHMFKIRVGLPPKNDWVASVNTMAAKFAMNKIRINKFDCPFLYKSVMGGIFNKTRTDFERNSTLGHCDALAALMYALRVQNHTHEADFTSFQSETVVSESVKETMSTPVFGKFKDQQTERKRVISPWMRR
jgi:hypothetical protein